MHKPGHPTLLIAGGGTGGHIQPALAIADAFASRHPDASIHFCGTAHGLESELIPVAGYPFHPIRARGFPHRPSLDLLPAVVDYFAGRKACSRLIRQYGPFAVVGTGGYVCGPLVAAAKRAGVPVLLHEQNAYPGRANRYLSRGAHTVCISYEGTETWFPGARRVVLTGNPVRGLFFNTGKKEARERLALKENERLVFVMGGSLGAATLNTAMLGWCAGGLPDGVRVVLMAGRKNADAVRREAAGVAGLDVRDYLQDAYLYMAAADLLVCRAGAITCAEIAALGQPSVMVPYPFAAGDHQTHNALAFERQGASIHMADRDFLPEAAGRLIASLLADPGRLHRMGEAAHALAMPDAAASIGEELEALLLESGHA
jgi:UDP-N-acetylglucosamine--N-acetylmuramyl-(pentapeptide) pyrophosphoryl-undecaprenol N-acetylglucosamine transferase